MTTSNVRWKVVGLLGLISALTFVDRVNLSIAGKYIQDEFAFKTESMGWILSAFSVGYALCQVPAGWLGDRFGPKKVITVAILWWSLFTIATAFAADFPWVSWLGMAWSFALVRFALGVGEAAAFPNSNRLIADWINPERRGTANSIFLVGIGLGGALTPIAISWIMKRWGWQSSFYICGALGLILAVGWYIYATDRPEEHHGVNPLELQAIRSASRQSNTALHQNEGARPENISLLPLFRNPSVWLLILSYLCIGYPAYIYYTWFFIYLVNVRHLPIETGGLWGSTPFIAILVLTPLGGWFSDRAAKRWGRRRGRQGTVWLGVVLSAIMLAAGARISNNTYAIVLLALAAGFNLFATPAFWATCNDLSPRSSGSLSGLMNMGGNIGGWLSPILTATIAVRFGWQNALYFGSLMTLVAGFFWFFIDIQES
ncbi:MAG: MFS transporter [Acidobacteria bacterium]|nr:MFS transporter [Acidobacteriota bacterium]